VGGGLAYQGFQALSLALSRPERAHPLRRHLRQDRDDDVVCVYDLSNRQIFQNLRFFDFVSITLEQLFCSSWYDYSSRPPEIEKILFEEGLQLLSGQVRHTVQPSAPEHLIEEKNTADLLKVRILVKWGSPIFLKGAPAGMIIVNRCALESGG
jgi:hypothetical protein